VSLPTIQQGAVAVRVLHEPICRHGVSWIRGDVVPVLPDDAARLVSMGVVEMVRPGRVVVG
jgi:hypothetical protein